MGLRYLTVLLTVGSLQFGGHSGATQQSAIAQYPFRLFR
jgi:hypothetical protein